MPWSVVEVYEDNGDVLTHIVPTVTIDGFKTKKQAEDFLKRVEASGPPGHPACLTDENENIIATFFGHRLKPDCPCGPKINESDPGLYMHKALN